MPFLSNAGVSLRYDRAGTGPAVLLVHGWCFNRTVWERQVVALRDRHTVITVDLRGHGESSHPRTGYSVGAMAADLEHLVRALGVPRVALVGWSMGGVVVAELARRLGDRVSAVAFVCAAVPLDAKLKTDAAAWRAGIEADFRAFVRELAPRMFKQGAESPLLAWAVSQLQKTPAHVAAAALDGVIAADVGTALKKLAAPTAVLHGRHDEVTPLSMGEALAATVPGAKLTVFEDSGHAPFLEEPDAFNEALTSLLATERSGTTRPAPARRPASTSRTPAKKRR